MEDLYEIAIIGSGPAGLSAAGRAAEYDNELREKDPSHGYTHVLLEGAAQASNTIFKYQKGKHVMDEPGFLDLRSPLEFSSGKREEVLETWDDGIKANNINVIYSCEVTAISGGKGEFTITCGDRVFRAKHAIMAIGMQGNPRRLGVPGDDSAFVQYQLDDPDEYSDEDIVVVGAGDAAIENAIALSRQNRVVIVNRKNEFSRAKEGNLNAVLAAINDPKVNFRCVYEASAKGLDLPSAEGEAGSMTLNTPEGDIDVPCHRIIARLGAIPPRKFIESSGIEFPSKDPEAIPELDGQYQSNVPGLYVIGALAGYPLIKQAMNQGYDVVEYIRGNSVKPADAPLLELKFGMLPYNSGVDEILALYQRRIPMFSRMNALAFRELVIESDIIFAVGDQTYRKEMEQRAETLKQQRLQDIEAQQRSRDEKRRAAGKEPKPGREASAPVTTKLLGGGDFVYRKGEYSNTFFTIVEGEVTLDFGDGGPSQTLTAGQFFGEMSLLSGRPRYDNAVAAPDTILIETPRRIMVKLMNSNDEVAAGIDSVFVQRALQRFFAPSVSYMDMRDIARNVVAETYNAGDVIFKEGDAGECLYLVRSGTVAMVRKGELAIGQIQSGQILGQMSLMGDPVRRETVSAAVRTELLRINRPEFLALLNLAPEAVTAVQRDTASYLSNANRMESIPEGGSIISFLLGRGVGEATNALIIDENLCVGCDNCEIACAETHDGLSRLDRKAGIRFKNINLAISCRHCEQPHCMKDCPANAIHRAASGEVFVDNNCIGCGNCQSNCPYDVIKMSYKAPKKPSLLNWLLFGSGPGLGQEANFEPTEEAKQLGKKAVKCDACMGRKGGPACVRACPVGAAQRLGPAEFVDLIADL